MRSIAAEAGIDPALIRHFFGDKENLFAQSLEFPDSVPAAIVSAFAAGSDGLGERLTRLYLGLWESQESGPILLALARSALGHPVAMDRFREFLVQTIGRGAAPYVKGDGAQLHLELAISQLLGVALARHATRTPSVVAASLDTIVAEVAPSIQVLLG